MPHLVEMIEKHYAIHLKNTLDAAAINVVRKKAAKGKPKTGGAGQSGRAKSAGRVGAAGADAD